MSEVEGAGHQRDAAGAKRERMKEGMEDFLSFKPRARTTGAWQRWWNTNEHRWNSFLRLHLLDAQLNSGRWYSGQGSKWNRNL